MACDTLSVIGISYATNPQTVANWNKEFRQNEFFHHPNPLIARGKKAKPPLFDLFPDVSEKITTYCNKNMAHLSIDAVHEHITTNIIPNLQTKPPHDDLGRQLINSFIQKPPCVITVWRWMKYLNYSYIQVKKTYYTDGHESEE